MFPVHSQRWLKQSRRNWNRTKPQEDDVRRLKTAMVCSIILVQVWLLKMGVTQKILSFYDWIILIITTELKLGSIGNQCV